MLSSFFLINRFVYILSSVCECVCVHASTLHMCETFGHVCSVSYVTVLQTTILSQLRS